MVSLEFGPVANVDVLILGPADWEAVEAVETVEAVGAVETVEAVAAGTGGPGVTDTGTDWITADWRTDWITNGRALSCLGGGLERLSITSDMACWAWDR